MSATNLSTEVEGWRVDCSVWAGVWTVLDQVEDVAGREAKGGAQLLTAGTAASY